jgi:hypothetical protein
MKKDITDKLTPEVDFWATVEAEIQQLVDIPSKTSVVHVMCQSCWRVRCEGQIYY